MHGIVSILDDQHYEMVETIWREFQQHFGIQGVRATPYPHFSYHVAPHYDLNMLEPMLEIFASQLVGFRVKATGLGIFTGENPVLYIPVVRTAELSELQEKLWDEISKHASGALDYYHPERWMPHITIAQGDIDDKRLLDVVGLLSKRDFSWDITVNNLSIIHDNGIEQVVKLRFGLR